MTREESYGSGTRNVVITLAVIAATILAAMVACQPGAAAHSSANLSTADFGSSGAPQVYSFRANPQMPTTLQFKAELSGIRFSAELRNSAGQVVAVLGSGTLSGATLTVPAGSDQYQVTVSSDGAGRVLLSLNTGSPDETVTAQTAAESRSAIPVSLNYSRPAASLCTLTVQNPAGVNLRGGPDASLSVLYVVPASMALVADMRTSGGWYRVNLNGTSGWILGDAVSLSGLCASLPVQDATYASAPPNEAQAIGGAVIPGVTAPYDQDSYYFGVDLDAGGRFNQVISYPAGDSTDRVLVSVGSFASAASANSRTFSLGLVCQGMGAEYVRWARRTTRRCAVATGFRCPSAPTSACKTWL
jgi:uncharacterized protein YraI